MQKKIDEAEETYCCAYELCILHQSWDQGKSSTNSKAEEFLTELQNLKTQEKEAYSTGISEDTPEILAFRRELDELAQKHLREVPKNKATSTTSVNSGSGSLLVPFLLLGYTTSPTKVKILGDPKSFVKTRSRVLQHSGAHALEPKKITDALKDDSWVEAMQVELLQFRLQQVYKVVKALYGLHQAPRAWYATLSTFLEKTWYRGSLCDEFEAFMKGRFQMSSMGKLIFFLRLQVKQKTDGIFISQDKYVADMLKKFDLASVKTAIIPMETKMALTKDEEADEVDVHLYKSMIGSLMYLTASRPDIMFAVCACSQFQVTPNTSHLNAVKRIFKYLKGKPNLGLWYPRESSFDLEAYSDSDYAGVNLDRKSTTDGCQFLGSRLISWQCKKQIIVAPLLTEVNM
ncbi:putative ribonuclease H-like domain-containing protein [Tanacetum coccineum]